MWMPFKAERDALAAANTIHTYMDTNSSELVIYCWGSEEMFRGEMAEKILQARADATPKCNGCGQPLKSI